MKTDRGVTPKTYRLLITGSRDASPLMLERARDAVQRAKVNGWEIVVGDAPGIDTAVVNACKEFEVFGECYGIKDKPRCEINEYTTYIWVKWTIIYGSRDVCVYQGADYLERDRQMVRHAQRCYAIWNGYSTGTRYTFTFARELQKPTDVAIYNVKEVSRG